MGEYKKIITEAIKESVNKWIEDLKESHPELMYTKQWRVIFPKGFEAGNNILPIVTSSKEGKRLIAEVSFLLPNDLELDTDGMNLTLKNEPFIESVHEMVSPAPVEDSLDLLNDMVVGISEFLSTLNIHTWQSSPKPVVDLFDIADNSFNAAPKVTIDDGGLNRFSKPLTSISDLESIKSEMLKSMHLPNWFKTIESRDVKEELLNKLAEGFYHYRLKAGGRVGFKEFFEEYTDFLKQSGKLYYYCTYKAKSVENDDAGWCQESYCSKKPYKAPCSITTLKFGSKPEEI